MLSFELVGVLNKTFRNLDFSSQFPAMDVALLVRVNEKKVKSRGGVSHSQSQDNQRRRTDDSRQSPRSTASVQARDSAENRSGHLLRHT